MRINNTHPFGRCRKPRQRPPASWDRAQKFATAQWRTAKATFCDPVVADTCNLPRPGRSRSIFFTTRDQIVVARIRSVAVGFRSSQSLEEDGPVVRVLISLATHPSISISTADLQRRHSHHCNNHHPWASLPATACPSLQASHCCRRVLLPSSVLQSPTPSPSSLPSRHQLFASCQALWPPLQ